MACYWPMRRGRLAVGTELCRGCVSVCACHPQPSASHSWFVLVFVVQGKGLVSTRAVGFHGDLNAKPTLSILQINYFASDGSMAWSLQVGPITQFSAFFWPGPLFLCILDYSASRQLLGLRVHGLNSGW